MPNVAVSTPFASPRGRNSSTCHNVIERGAVRWRNNVTFCL